MLLARLRAGLTLGEAARLSGLSIMTVGEAEREVAGRWYPSDATIKRLTDLYAESDE